MLKLYVKAQRFLQFLKDESGQDMIEYALLAALIGVVIAGAIPGLTDAISGVFTTVEGKLTTPGA